MKISSRKPKQLVDWQVIVKQGAALNLCPWSRCPGLQAPAPAETSLLLPTGASAAGAPLQRGRSAGGDTSVLEEWQKKTAEERGTPRQTNTVARIRLTGPNGAIPCMQDYRSSAGTSAASFLPLPSWHTLSWNNVHVRNTNSQIMEFPQIYCSLGKQGANTGVREPS